MKNPRFSRSLFALVLFLVLMSFLSLGSVSAAGPANLLANGSFEAGVYAPEYLPDGWQHEAWRPSAEFMWQDGVAYLGEKSIKISSPEDNDAQWNQSISVKPQTSYLLSGWIKTEDVAHSNQSIDAGANLCLAGTWTRTEGVIGTHDWTYVSLRVDSGNQTELTICARLGYWSGTTSGTAWFDQIKLIEIDPSASTVNWKILALIYQNTDFTYRDGADVEHHVITTLTDAEMQQAAQRTQQFVEVDIPALSSGNMVPELTIRYPTRTITELSPYSDRWWLSPEDSAPERDAEFDAVLAIWNPTGIDMNTDAVEHLNGNYAGLAADRGTGQIYTTIISDAATVYPHRNVFKHEFGHSILFYFDAAGTSPKPTVTNHAVETQYVNCISGAYYVWVDETENDPIPNSIYNNESGFTHDYYSGTTATADQPSRCLGVTPEAWATGGPVSRLIYYGFETAVDLVDQSGDPGTAVSFELQVTNTGNASDSYQVSYAGNQWQVNGPATIGPLEKDSALATPITVTIPADAYGLEEDTVTVTITSETDGSLYEVQTVKTTANVVRGVTLSPAEAAAFGNPGTTAATILTVINSGNVSDTFSLSVSNSKWAVDIPAAVSPLEPGQSQEIEALVAIAAEAAEGEMDMAIITATSQADASISTTATLTTTAFGDEAPGELIGNLIVEIEVLIDQGVIKKGNGNSFIQKLKQAVRALDKDQTEKAVQKLENFISKVNDKAGKALPEETAAQLVEEAQRIIATIEAG